MSNASEMFRSEIVLTLGWFDAPLTYRDLSNLLCATRSKIRYHAMALQKQGKLSLSKNSKGIVQVSVHQPASKPVSRPRGTFRSLAKAPRPKTIDTQGVFQVEDDFEIEILDDLSNLEDLLTPIDLPYIEDVTDFARLVG